jgi:hypothetical protein
MSEQVAMSERDRDSIVMKLFSLNLSRMGIHPCSKMATVVGYALSLSLKGEIIEKVKHEPVEVK